MIRALWSGFLILLPALLAYLLIGGFYDLLVLMTQPLADVIPQYGLLSDWERQLLQIGLMLVIFVLVGFAGRTAFAKRIGLWMENEMFGRFPPYRVVREITHQLSGRNVPNMQGVLVPVGPTAKTVGFIVEELKDDYVTVFIPLTSVPTIGQLQIMRKSSVEPINASFMDSLGWYFNWGKGTEVLLGGKTKNGLKRDDVC